MARSDVGGRYAHAVISGAGDVIAIMHVMALVSGTPACTQVMRILRTSVHGECTLHML
jgi:hypothetical protein